MFTMIPENIMNYSFYSGKRFKNTEPILSKGLSSTIKKFLPLACHKVHEVFCSENEKIVDMACFEKYWSILKHDFLTAQLHASNSFM